MIHSMRLSSLFAEKIHAILCRNWTSRPKGRDWYDLVWYISHDYGVDLKHLNARLQQSCDWQKREGVSFEEAVTQTSLLALLKKRIEALDISSAKRDVEPFVADIRVLDIWSREFFLGVVEKVRVE